VLDEHFNVLWGSFQSQPFQETNLDFFGKGLKALIASTRAYQAIKISMPGSAKREAASPLWALG
jgi:hypothetical protein